MGVNILSGTLGEMAVHFERAIPIFRIFSVEKAREFYLDFLGFTVDWEHRFDENAPVYMQISRGNLIFHLSEHHGDACPGSTTFVSMTGIDEFHAEVSDKKYSYMQPGVEREPWNAKSMGVIDPFGNRIRFNELLKEQRQPAH